MGSARREPEAFRRPHTLGGRSAAGSPRPADGSCRSRAHPAPPLPGTDRAGRNGETGQLGAPPEERHRVGRRPGRTPRQRSVFARRGSARTPPRSPVPDRLRVARAGPACSARMPAHRLGGAPEPGEAGHLPAAGRPHAANRGPGHGGRDTIGPRRHRRPVRPRAVPPEQVTSIRRRSRSRRCCSTHSDPGSPASNSPSRGLTPPPNFAGADQVVEVGQVGGEDARR